MLRWALTTISFYRFTFQITILCRLITEADVVGLQQLCKKWPRLLFFSPYHERYIETNHERKKIEIYDLVNLVWIFSQVTKKCFKITLKVSLRATLIFAIFGAKIQICIYFFFNQRYFSFRAKNSNFIQNVW